MGRIRSIKPELGHHDKLSALHPEIHLFAALLPTYADDYGYFQANPRLVHAGICPLRELFVSIPEIFMKLSEIGYLELFTGTDGREYGKIVNFLKHQRVAHPSESKIKALEPSPEIFVKPPENFSKPHDIFAPDLGTGNREQGTGNREALDGEVHEIAALHPKIKDAFHLPQDIAFVIAEAILRDGRDLVWSGTHALKEAVVRWPARELQFVPSAQKFFRESQYRNPPEFWERNGNGKLKTRGEEVRDAALDARAAARRAIGLDH
jgi:hypothetical protein